ncbi:MAG: hypothetical protein V3Q69_02965 [Burkholderia sp.]
MRVNVNGSRSIYATTPNNTPSLFGARNFMAGERLCTVNSLPRDRHLLD